MKAETKITHSQSVAILVDGNNIGKSINSIYGKNAMMDFDEVVPNVLCGRGLNRLVYLREGTTISKPFTERLRKHFFGTVETCHKSADVPLTIHAVKLAEKVDTIIIFSGDSDYVPLVIYLKSAGVRVEIVCIKESASQVLIDNSDDFYYLAEADIFFNKSKLSNLNSPQ